MNFEDEIEVLESLVGNLEAARLDALQSEYHQYMASSLELDIDEVQERLSELYAMQDELWKKELQQQNFEYEREVLLWIRQIN